MGTENKSGWGLVGHRTKDAKAAKGGAPWALDSTRGGIESPLVTRYI